MTARNEQWRPVPGFPLYEVSSLGRVRSLPRLDSLGRKQGGKIVRPYPNKARGSHLQIGLVPAPGERAITKWLHPLILTAFVGPRPAEGMHACHRDDDPMNNAVSNLYWGTPKENAEDLVRNGKHHYARRTHCAEGHPLSGNNLIESTETLKTGSVIRRRRCRACKRKRENKA